MNPNPLWNPLPNRYVNKAPAHRSRLNAKSRSHETVTSCNPTVHLMMPYYTLRDATHSLQPVSRGDSVKLIQTNIDLQKKTDAIANANIRLQPRPGPYDFNIHFGDGPRQVTSFFRRPTYCVLLSTGMTSNALLIMASLFNLIASPNLIDKDFLPPAGNKSAKPIIAS